MKLYFVKSEVRQDGQWQACHTATQDFQSACETLRVFKRKRSTVRNAHIAGPYSSEEAAEKAAWG